jgi:hypothetical protein
MSFCKTHANLVKNLTVNATVKELQLHLIWKVLIFPLSSLFIIQVRLW